MFRFQLAALAVTLLWSVNIEAKFPNDPKPCPYGDTQCIKKVISFLLSEQAEGYAPLNFAKIHPLKISDVHIRQGKESPVNIDLRFRNLDIWGMKDSQIIDVKGFGNDLSKRHELLLEANTLTMYSDYAIQGRVLILPISGTGKSNITIENNRIKVIMHGEPVVKDGETYMQLKDLKVTFEPKRIHFDFSNLFNGDKTLGDTMNKFLNDNWKDIYNELRGAFEKTFSEIMKSIINAVFTKYPYEKLFAVA